MTGLQCPDLTSATLYFPVRTSVVILSGVQITQLIHAQHTSIRLDTATDRESVCVSNRPNGYLQIHCYLSYGFALQYDVVTIATAFLGYLVGGLLTAVLFENAIPGAVARLLIGAAIGVRAIRPRST